MRGWIFSLIRSQIQLGLNGKQQRRQNGAGPVGSPPPPHLPSPPTASAHEYQSALTATTAAVRKKPTSAHQIVSGSGDILTRRRQHHNHLQNGGKDGPNRKFSSIVNEYVSNCMEDNCNIGEGEGGFLPNRFLSDDCCHEMLSPKWRLDNGPL